MSRQTSAVLYAALISIVYVTWLFVVEPHVLRGEANQVALLLFNRRHRYEQRR